LLNPGLVVNHHLLPAAWGFVVFKLIALFVTTWFVIRWLFRSGCKDEELFIVGVSSLFALVPLLIIGGVTRYRYGMPPVSG